MNYFKIFYLLLFAFTTLSANVSIIGQARRVVLNEKNKSGRLTVSNSGNEEMNYSVKFVQMKMDENGKMTEVKNSELTDTDKVVSKYVRVFPLRFRLKPGKIQRIKLNSRARGVQPGEYISYLTVEASPVEKPLVSQTPNNGIGTLINTRYRVSAPAILRVGQDDSKVTLSNLSVDGKKNLSLIFNRTGNMSVYGSIKAVYKSPSGKQTVVGEVDGIAVYAYNSSRNFKLPLKNYENVDLNSGSIEVTYSKSNEEVLAKNTLRL